jgi:hypothetical protein
MLTLKHILDSMRMMEQTGGSYRGFYEDHIPDHPCNSTVLPENYHLKPGERSVRVCLHYETDPNGDMRIVQE